VRVLGGPLPLQERELVAGGLYLSSSDASLTFATGTAAHVRIEVDWRDGRRSVIDSAVPNREYEIAEPGQSARVTHDERRHDARSIRGRIVSVERPSARRSVLRRLSTPATATQLIQPARTWRRVVDLDGDGKKI